jgi:hypothetical protein
MKLKNTQPGIIGLMVDYPTTAKPLNALAQQLLRDEENDLPIWFREFLAYEVSNENNTPFCAFSHLATAVHLSSQDNPKELGEVVKANEKFMALIRLARAVARNLNTTAFMEEAIKLSSQSQAHLTVLIASAFCMYNRYVDGCNTLYSANYEDYQETGKRLAESGYIDSIETPIEKPIEF